MKSPYHSNRYVDNQVGNWEFNPIRYLGIIFRAHEVKLIHIFGDGVIQGNRGR